MAVIRAHGVAPEVLQALRQRGAQVVDTTCPFVSRIHRRAAQAVAEGRDVIIVGEREHSEVKGIQGWCQGHGYVVGDLEDVERLPKLQRALVVAQTTSKKAHFDCRAGQAPGANRGFRGLLLHLPDHGLSPRRGRGA